MINQQFIENWVNREIKSIIKGVDLTFVCKNLKCFPRSGPNSLVEPIADLTVKGILNHYEKVYFLSLKYYFNYPNPQLSRIIFSYAWFKALNMFFRNIN